MLKGLVTWFLNNYLGKYLENLNTDQLSIALLHGEVELENVPLRRDALRFVDTSLEVKNGLVGRVKLKIPVSGLRSEPWSIVMERVYLVITPQSHADYDELQDEAVTQEIKLAALDGIESEWRAKYDVDHTNSYYPSYTAWMSFGTSFIGTILENLQVQICDVHIRYEDTISSGQLFSCGILLESLSAQSCDQNWIPKFIQREPGNSTSFKLVELQSLAMYVNTDGDSFCDIPREELLEKMSTANRGNWNSNQYVLNPISANAMIRRNCTEKPLNSKKTPRLHCNLELGQVEFRISDQQYQTFVLAGRQLWQLQKNRKFWRWRPREPLKGNTKAWWQYAITCHMEQIHEEKVSRTWGNVLAKARENVMYVSAFEDYLKNPVTLEPDHRDLKSEIDASRPYSELKILRELAVSRLEKELPPPSQQTTPPATTPTDLNESTAAQSMLQGWFPLWWGWYGQDQQPGISGALKEDGVNESLIEDELLEALADDVNNLVPYHDVLFLQMSFSVSQCLIKLESNDKVLFDMEFGNTLVEIETRPRTQSTKFVLSLGGMFIRDHVTTDSLFPTLISPQEQAKKNVSSFGHIARTLQTYMSLKSEHSDVSNGPIFHLLYEKKPFSSKIDHRLHIKSKPLNIVYNAVVLDCLRRFLEIPDPISQKIKNAAYDRIEEVKERTKQELRKNMMEWLDDSEHWKKNWDLMLDLSAPQIIIPEHFVDKEATLLILDFGKFYVTNGTTPPNLGANQPTSPKPPSAFWSSPKEEDSESDDEFVTPASSPATPTPPLDFSGGGDQSSKTTAAGIEEGLRKKIYETFTIQLCDMQVIVGRLKDNWRYAQLKGTSSLHVLDKFNISLQLDRRLVPSTDHLLPKFALSGTLPRLSMHVNEDKVAAVDKIVTLLSRGDDERKSASLLKDQFTQTLFSGYQSSGSSEDLATQTEKTNQSAVDEASVIFLVYFCITEMSVEIQSLGKSIVELQVRGVKASLTKRRCDTSLGLSVHSLLLVDAIQTLGPNFELLVASHKNVSVDSSSGSLKGSDPVSPASPISPGPSVQAAKTTSPTDIALALSALQKNRETNLDSSDFVDPDSLISVEITIIDRSEFEQQSEKLMIVSIQFNSLDIIANQETIIELIYFARRIMPATMQMPLSRKRKMPTKEQMTQTDEETSTDNLFWFDQGESKSDKLSNTPFRTEVTADFQRLNVLLLRAVTGKMIGTALLTEVRVHLQLSDMVSATGSLGGLQVNSLLPGSQLHQRIISVGKDPAADSVKRVRGNNVHADLYLDSKPSRMERDIQAFSFSIEYRSASIARRDYKLLTTTPIQENGPCLLDASHKVDVQIRMASVCYVHSSNFIRELNSFATEFRLFLSQLAASITSAATDLALGIVQRRTESISRTADMNDIYWGVTPNRPRPDKFSSLERGFNSKIMMAPAPTPAAIGPLNTGIDVKFNAILETPIVVLPRADRSHEVLVGHLGLITIRNETFRGFLGDRIDRVKVSLENMNVYSLDIKAQIQKLHNPPPEDALEVMSVAKSLSAVELYSCNSKVALPILHDTEISVVLERSFTSSTAEGDEEFQSLPVMDLSVKSLQKNSVELIVINPLKVSLQRNQYDQILDTVSFLMQAEGASAAKESTAQTKTVAPAQGDHVPLDMSLSLPKLIFELCAEGASIGKPLVSVHLDDFLVKTCQPRPGENVTEITLGSIEAEDLSCEDIDSRHRKLITSITALDRDSEKKRPFRRSTSCPQLNEAFSFDVPLRLSKNRGSLPQKLNTLVKDLSTIEMAPQPSTPPPSECESSGRSTPYDDNLVHIEVKDVSPMGQKHRQINVDFNTLDIIFSLQSWVIILDFFGIGSPKVSSPQKATPIKKRSDEQSEFTQTMDFKVKSLSIVLNHSNYEVARVSVNTFLSHLAWKKGCFTIEGTLKKFLVTDLTSSGLLYTERFLSMQGHNDVLTFHFFKHNDEKVALYKPFDASLKLRMASIIYVHTHRFYSELLAFFSHFQQHQNVMSRIRIAAMGSAINETASRGMRLQLDVEAGSPLLLLPVSAASTRLIVVHLGFLTIQNSFKLAGDDGTISSQTLRSALSAHLLQNRRRRRSSSRSSRRSRRSGFKSPSSMASSRRRSLNRRGVTSASDEEDEGQDELAELAAPPKCLLDVLNVNLSSMDLRTADRLSVFTENLDNNDIVVGGFVVRQHEQKLLKQTCELQLQVERNLDKAFNHQVPDLSINGSLSKVHVSLDGQQYAMVRGLLAHNLGENLDDLAQFHVAVPTNEYQDPDLQTLLSGLAWTCLYMNIGLHDVILDLRQDENPLARVSLVRSVLTFESFSDGSRDVDLVSQDILLNDLRFEHLPMNKRPSVFPQILRPLEREAEESLLQAEVHFRLTPDTNRITILVNNMRLLGIFDWWMCLLDFVTQAPEEASNLRPERPNSSQMEDVMMASSKTKGFPSDEPLYPSAGILSRRAPVVETGGPVFELKLNITDCDFIIISDPSMSDSTAVILRSTTVIAYRPDMVDRPFSCNLNNAEVFSCILNNEEDSALSIIDPVTINLEIAGRSVPGMPSKGLSDLLVEKEDGYHRLGTYERTAEIQLQQLNVRISYQDWLVFQKIMDSFPKQAHDAFQGRGGEGPVDKDLGQLISLGFRPNDCREALMRCQGHLDEAALWLTQNCSPIPLANEEMKLPKRYFMEGSKVSFTNFECKISTISLCVIDDCRDADVPLLDLTFNRLHFRHDFERIGEASCVVASSYYNRYLSSWEPLMEPWKCSVGWKVGEENKRLAISMEAEETVNFNLTTTLMELYRRVKVDWSATETSWKATTAQQVMARGCTRRRMPFTPFTIKNDTGLALWFRRLTKDSMGPSYSVVEQWIKVDVGEEMQFSFETSRKDRSLGQSGHQIIILVEGWQEVSPVTIDRVGVFFRKAIPTPTISDDSPPPIRIVCEVVIRGAGLKLVTVRSALVMQNRLAYPIELRLENTSKFNDFHHMVLSPGQNLPIPMRYVWARMSCRPHSTKLSQQWKYSDKKIEWYPILSPADNVLVLHCCYSQGNTEPQRFCVSIKRMNYPLDNSETLNVMDKSWIQPAHTVIFVPPVIIVNLLPCHLMFNFKGEVDTKGSVSPGKECFISADIEKNSTVEFSMDNFPHVGELTLHAGRLNFEGRMVVTDLDQRQLHLGARVESNQGGAVRISIFVRHWLVNKTGLPLVFRQEGASVDVAGQEEANENARMAAPLMFSFIESLSETSSNSQLTVRLGNGLHSDGSSQWCRSFPLQPGSRVRKLVVVPNDNNRVSRIYIIGIDVRVGKGRYRDTLIVTLAPRFQVHNQTSYRVQFSQRCFATTFHDLEAEASHLQAFPQSSLAYHWPRIDRDQLLCLRVVEENGAVTLWSGGMVIDRIDSFHLALHDKKGGCFFLRIEVSLIGATFCTILTDAGNFPPPFRIDNFAEVSVTCHQSGVQDENLKTIVKAHQSVPFAWDEPTFSPFITCHAPGGSSATYNMNVLGEGAQLTYENFIYIVMTASMEGPQLVFDVDGTKVFLAPKEAGKRSQLWRMTSSGMLQHEGSSPPQDPTASHQEMMRKSLVLDIAGPAVQPNKYVPLMLRKPDERRQLTQKWRFTDDGRLMCAHRGLYVQAKDGFSGFKRGNDVVLGPIQPLIVERMEDTGVPLEQAICRQRMRPGSGSLCVRIYTDGPTRVLQISDVSKVATRGYAALDVHPANQEKVAPENAETDCMDLQVTFNAKGGVGISLVCRDPPEELLYAFLSNVVIDYQNSGDQTTLDGSVQNIQVDNQMSDSQYPTLLYLSPATRHDEYRHLPAVTFAVHRMKSEHNNAEIYKHLMVQVKNITFNLEEEVLYKVFKFAGITRTDEEMERMDETAYETQYALINATKSAKRYYFGTLKLSLNQIKLSVTKSLKLTPDLMAVRRKLGLSLIAFEDALIDLDPFVRVHPFETINFLTNSVVKHYTDELLSQAVLILGATDFLGNPIGFFNDITEGVSGLVSEGDVSGLIKNVAHGAANSAAKVTGSLSYGISKATVYDKYNEKRLMLRRQRGDRSKEYLVDGLKGLGFGVFQGLTSIVTETYDGVASDGLSGFFSGLTWGLIGTVSKPALGVLDLATGAATAVKESSRGRSKELPAPLRLPRLVRSAGGSMLIYSRSDAQGQQLLHGLNGHDHREIFIAHHLLRFGPDENLQMIISSLRILVFGASVNSGDCVGQKASSAGRKESKEGGLRIMMDIFHGQLVCARALVIPEESENKHYVELVGQMEEESSYKRPRVRCDGETLARLVAQQINYALDMFQENQMAVIENENEFI